jgi:hypothetical protein
VRRLRTNSWAVARRRGDFTVDPSAELCSNKLENAAAIVVDMMDPLAPGDAPCSLLERLHDLLTGYISKVVASVDAQVLNLVKSYLDACRTGANR